MLFVVAMCQHRIGRRQESIQSYLELVRVAEEGKLNPLSSSEATAMYNLACAYSLTGEKAKAVDWLLRAVKLGFRDRAWMKIDKDLDPIRGEAAFQKLMGDDALFEKRGDADEFPERGDPRPLPDK
jgi:hypothetical protein